VNSLVAIRSGLAANLAATYGSTYQVTPFSLSAPVPPGFQFMPDRIDFHGTLGQNGMDTYRFILIGTVGYASDVAAQDVLDLLLGDQENVSDPLSVRQALESDQNLTSRLQADGSITTGQPAAADDVTVVFATGYRLYGLQDAQQLALGAEWTVDVRT
jgi:hypothetical protein